MRMLLKFQFDTETANRAIEDGSMARINEKMFTQMQPEVAYFAIEDGVRTGYLSSSTFTTPRRYRRSQSRCSAE